MVTDGRMDEEDVVRVHNKLLISHKKKKKGISPFATRWVDEGTVLSGVSQTGQGKHCVIHFAYIELAKKLF